LEKCSANRPWDTWNGILLCSRLARKNSAAQFQIVKLSKSLFTSSGLKSAMRLSGTYDFLRWGEIAPHHVSLLPTVVLDNWVNGMLNSQWGKSSIDDANNDLEDGAKISFTQASVLQALHDGRLRIPFTILRCVGYPHDWFERLIFYEKTPKPKPKKVKTGTPKKRRGVKAQESPNKRPWTSQMGKGKVKVEEESAEENVEETDDGEFPDSQGPPNKHTERHGKGSAESMKKGRSWT
jgi:hypothetical protein